MIDDEKRGSKHDGKIASPRTSKQAPQLYVHACPGCIAWQGKNGGAWFFFPSLLTNPTFLQARVTPPPASSQMDCTVAPSPHVRMGGADNGAWQRAARRLNSELNGVSFFHW